MENLGNLPSEKKKENTHL